VNLLLLVVVTLERNPRVSGLYRSLESVQALCPIPMLVVEVTLEWIPAPLTCTGHLSQFRLCPIPMLVVVVTLEWIPAVQVIGVSSGSLSHSYAAGGGYVGMDPSQSGL
jgi:hypothetical protein